MLSSLARIIGIDNNLPSAEWVREQAKKTLFTPDIALLEKRRFQWLFEYGEAQPKHEEYKTFLEGYTENVPPMAAFSLNPFSCYKQALGKLSHPVALEGARFNVHLAPIKGSLIGVASSRLIELDNHRMNGVAFQRHRVKVQVPHIKQVWHKERQGLTNIICEPEILSAWMYVGVPEYWNEMLDNGFITKNLNTYGDLSGTIPRYYQFTRRDYGE